VFKAKGETDKSMKEVRLKENERITNSSVCYPESKTKKITFFLQNGTVFVEFLIHATDSKRDTKEVSDHRE